MHAVVETPRFLADAVRLFTEQEREVIVVRVAADPRCGVVVPGGEGIRKFRVGFGGRGKRGGARVVYLLGGTDVPIFLLAAFAKKRKGRFDQGRTLDDGKGGKDYSGKLSETTMSKRAFDKIMQGIKDAGAYLDGSADKRRYRVHIPTEVNVKKIRNRLGLSQEAFAQKYGFALSAVRDWEQGRRRPERSARILLKIVEKEPEAVTRALAG